MPRVSGESAGPILPPPSGPYVNLAVLCREWVRDPDGTTSIRGIVDALTWSGSVRRANGTFASRPHLQFVLELVAGFIRGEFPLDVALRDSHGRLIGERQVHRKWFDADDAVERIVERLRIPEVAPGQLHLEVSSGGRLVTQRVFAVRSPDTAQRSNVVESGIDWPPVLTVARHCVGAFDVSEANDSVLGMFEGLGLRVPARANMGFMAYFASGSDEATQSVAITTYGPDGTACSPTYTFEAEFRPGRTARRVRCARRIAGIGHPDRPAHRLRSGARAHR